MLKSIEKILLLGYNILDIVFEHKKPKGSVILKKKILSITLVAAILLSMLTVGIFSVSAAENVIKEVDLEINAPLSGQQLSKTTPNMSNYSADYYMAGRYWCDENGDPLGEDGVIPDDLTFEAGQTYYVHYSLIASEGCEWMQDVENTTLTIRNGTAVGTLSMDSSEEMIDWYGQPAAVGVLAVEAVEMPEGLITDVELNFNAPVAGEEVTLDDGKLTPAPDVTIPENADYSIADGGEPVWVDSDDFFEYQVLSEPFTIEKSNTYYVYLKLIPSEGRQFDSDYTELKIKTGCDYSTSIYYNYDDAMQVIISFDADSEYIDDENIIDSIYVSAVSPIDGTTSTEFAPQVTLSAVNCEVYDARWLYTPDEYPAEDPYIEFEAGEYYTMLVTIKADEGYSFEKSENYATGIDEGLDVFYGVYSSNNTSVAFAGSYTVDGIDYLRLKLDVHAVRPAGPMSYIHVLQTQGGHVEFWSNEYDGDYTQPYGVPEGAQVRLSAIADNGYEFKGWYKGDVNASSYDEMFTDELITTENPYVFNSYGYPYICAKFEYTGVDRQGDQIQVWVTDGGKAAVEYTPSYDDDAYIKPLDGTDYVSVGEVVALWKGDEITVHQKADEGYKFKGWYHVRIEWGPEDEQPKYEGDVISTDPTFTYKPGVTVVEGDTEPLRYVCAAFEPDQGSDKLIGDANGDGVVDVLDAATIQKYAAGKTNLSADQLYVADVNNDNNVDVLDAAQIQKYSVGKISEFKKKS